MSTTWLPLSVRKGIPKPKIVIEPDIGQNYGGYYISGTSNLVVVESELLHATIAHEYTHYVQDFTNTNKSTISTATFWDRWSSKLGYDAAITKYFTSFPSELEALHFEYKVAKTWVNDSWLNELVLPNY